MKQIKLIFYFLITPSIGSCSITRERDQNYNIVCSSAMIVKMQAYSYGTYFIAERGTICDVLHNRESMSTLLTLNIAQKIDQKEISQNRTAFLITTAVAAYLALIYNPERPTTIDFYDIRQPSKIFASDPEIVQELKRSLITGRKSQR